MDMQKIIAGLRMIADGLESGLGTPATERTKRKIEQMALPLDVSGPATASKTSIEGPRPVPGAEQFLSKTEAQKYRSQAERELNSADAKTPHQSTETPTVPPPTAPSFDLAALQVKFRQAVHHNRDAVKAALQGWNAKALREIPQYNLPSFEIDLDNILKGAGDAAQ